METLNEPAHFQHPISQPEDIGALRRSLRALGHGTGLAEKLIANAELAATELGTNLLRHALPGGYLLYRLLAQRRGIELISVDFGPGIGDVTRVLAGRTPADFREALRDGRKLQGMGMGLASVRRLAGEFDLFSRASFGGALGGTVVLARVIDPSSNPLAVAGQRVAGVSVAIDQSGCGDGWSVVHDSRGTTLLLVDGLGHGHKAELAANAAVEVLHGGYDGSLADYFTRANRAMRSTRGGAVSLCRVDGLGERLSFGGAGNVEGRVFLHERSYSLVPRPGTLGISITMPTIRFTESDWEPGATLILHSDGLRVSLDPGLCRLTQPHDPAILAALLHRDGVRGKDDATIVVIQDRRSRQP